MADKKIQFDVEGMHCESCVKKIKERLQESGVAQTDVDLDQRQVIVSFNPKDISGLQLKKTISDAGYAVTKMKVL